MEKHDHHSNELDELTGDKLISGHEYDDIRELDNKLPRWWVWLFIITIVYAAIYLVLFDVTGYAPHQKQEYANELAEAGIQPGQSTGNETAALTQLNNQADLDAGKAIWVKHCLVCHLEGGQGLVGPNLTDSFAIHGCSFPDVVKIITIGVPEKGMISWKSQLNPNQIAQVSSYVMLLLGTTPPNPKTPQGQKCP
jgi:cytochrome c oxidase cbb3-type subunit 3